MSRFFAGVLVCCLQLACCLSTCRAQEVRPKPNVAEAKILAALGEPTQLDFVNQPLSDVVEYLTEHHKIPVQLDNKALADSGLGSDTPVTARFDGISLRSALHLLLHEMDLTYVVRNEVLFITSQTEAENLLEFRIYPVGDLVACNSELGRTRRGLYGMGGPLSDDEPCDEDYQTLVELITTAVAPTTWDEVGGPGPRMEFSNAHALAVSQTFEVHEEIAALLAALRAARDKQLQAAKALVQAADQPAIQGPELLQVRVYPLVFPPRGVGGGLGGGFFAVPSEPGREEKEASTKPADASDRPPELPYAQFDKWTKELAAMAPEVVAPESWAPRGKGNVWPAPGSLIVRQTETVHRKVQRMLAELGVSYSGMGRRLDEPALKLAVTGPQPDWPQAAEPQPNTKEEAIERALDGKLDLSFVDQPLADVVSYIEQTAKFRVQLDNRALADAGLGSDTPITRRLVGLSLRAALRLMLSELDLTYVVRDEVLLITTKTEAENMLTTKVYPVFDLVVRAVGAEQKGASVDYQSLSELIRCNVAPTTWNGGPGAIQEFPNAGALVVGQTTEVHEQLARFLQALREVGAEQR